MGYDFWLSKRWFCGHQKTRALLDHRGKQEVAARPLRSTAAAAPPLPGPFTLSCGTMSGSMKISGGGTAPGMPSGMACSDISTAPVHTGAQRDREHKDAVSLLHLPTVSQDLCPPDFKVTKQGMCSLKSNGIVTEAREVEGAASAPLPGLSGLLVTLICLCPDCFFFYAA